ncbi:TnsA endonuclease N-terminal domain-containing protein [Paenibacillus sediminis]|uniref:Heteromeric transposase endonuclease subunit TnsA n=1 Tax=Paenibacillus sediminis TaxID=664909 RepID=A0ABS4H473_9BACL|nr:TnsA endonuclease N-terminal domain-containing protein [Paenibacillus sediminis]MBP1937306.1 hypothetical protein [Paenibacillus sediminis]
MSIQKQIQKKVKEGRGQGIGKDYLPWFTAKQVSSRGKTFRPKGIKTGREHLFLSEWEYFYFLLTDWSGRVFDMREQYPLLDSDLMDIKETIQIAKELNVDHPIEPKINDLKVITTDFLLKYPDNSEVAVSFKPFRLITPREVEKMEIERIYWESRGVPWELVTDKDIPVIYAKNVDYVHSVYDLTGHQISESTIAKVKRLMEPQLLKGTRGLTEITNEIDDKLGLLPGNSLTISRHLISTKKWIIDMEQPIIPYKPLLIQEIPVIKTLEADFKYAN